MADAEMHDRRALLGWWPLVADWVRSELMGYLLRTSDPSRKALSTRWQPWTVLDITRHLAASFERFIRLLRQSRVGDLRPPFEPGRAVSGEPARGEEA
jgi:hypothetical protein